MPGKTLPFRLYAQILIFSALVALGALILWPLQRAMQGGLLSIRNDFITRLEQQIDRKIQFSSISPSIFGSFDVRNVRIMGENGQAILTISRFRIAYSLADLLRGKPQGIHSVWVDTPFIDFNMLYDHDLFALFKGLNTRDDRARQDFAAIFPERFIARIRNGKCMVVNGKDQFEVTAPNLNVEIAGDRIILDGRWSVNAAIDNPVGKPVNLYIAMRANGSFLTNMEEGEAVFSIPAITGNSLSVSPFALGLVLKDNVVRVGKMPDDFAFDFFVEYGLENGTIDLQMDCSRFRLGDFISFSGELAGAHQLLDIAGSGEVLFERRHDGTLAYAVALSGEADALLDETSFAIVMNGDEKRAHINTLHFSLSEPEKAKPLFVGDIGFDGSIGLQPFAPDGILSLYNFSLSGAESLNAEVIINPHNNGGINIWSETLDMGKAGLNTLNALLRYSEQRLDFTASARSLMHTGSFTLEGTLNTALRRVEATLGLSAFSGGDLTGLALPFVKNVSIPAPLAGLLGGTAITTEVFFTADSRGVTYNAPGFVFTGGLGKKTFAGFVVLSGTNRYVELHNGRFAWDKEILSLSGRADFSGIKDFNFSINTRYRDIEYFVEGVALDGKTINIQGSHDLKVTFADSGSRGYNGSLYAADFPVPFLGYPAFISLSAQLHFDAASSWSMNLDRLTLTNIASPAGLAQIQVSGSANQDGANFPLLYYRDNLGPLSGSADISWPEDYARFTGTAGIMEGTEIYRVTGSYVEDYGNLLVFSGSSMRLERMFGGNVNALADGELRILWDSPAQGVDYFRAELKLPSVRGTLHERELGLSAHALLSGGELVVSDLNFRLGDLEGEVPYFIMNSVQGTVGSRAELRGFAGQKPVKGSLSLAAHFNPLRSWFEINQIAHSFTGKLKFEEFIYGNGGDVQIFDIDFSRADGAFSVLGGPRDMIRFQMDQDGNFYGGLSRPFPVRGTIIGSIKHRTINARCGDLYVDMAELFNLLPASENFYLTGGYVSASLDIRGSLTDPEFFGTARGTSLRIRIPNYVTHEVRPIPFSIVIDGNEIRFGPVSAAVGNGAATVRGWFRVDRWIPNIFSIDIAIPRETPVPYGFDVGGFVARGDAAGNLNVSMENLTFDVSGDLYANNTEMGIDTEEISRSRRTGASARRFPAILNFTISTGPVVEFFYPTSRFPILRANPDMGTKIHVTADTLAQQYSLTGDVRIRGGEIFYFERRFYIRSGTLLLRENELRFDPRLTARAEVRDRTEDGPITISMIVDNAPLRSFTARFESNPPLTQMEIFSLLGHTLTGAQYDQNADSLQRAFLNSGSELLAQYIVGRQLEQQIRNFMGLDMFNVRTHVLQNAFLMSTGLLQQPVDRIDRVGNYFDNTTVFGGKYIGQDMFVQGMLSMRYDSNREATGGLTFVPDLGVELQSPLFSIRWDFAPAHPENWYVNDNSITLTWSRTF